MSEQALERVKSLAESFVDPYMGIDLGSAKAVKEVAVVDGKARVAIELGYPMAGVHDRWVEQLRRHVGDVAGVSGVEVAIRTQIVTHQVQRAVKPLSHIKNTIAVASGKGGVGKSTTAVNLALALAAEGAQVALLDADIYGPSQARMLGSREKPTSRDGRSMEPVMAHGIQAMSMGFLVDEESPMIWRGPMVTQALEQLLRDTRWQPADYLVIDLPPGTGDTQLTLAQRIPVTGAVIVTTPQDIALLDARKGLKMFEKVSVPVLGIVENMSVHVCSQCGHQEPVFGTGGGERMARDYDVDLLGQLPLERSIREHADSGRPSVVADPEGAAALIYREVARKVAAKIACLGRDYSHKFPNIVVQNT